jgi:hypothetical protein
MSSCSCAAFKGVLPIKKNGYFVFSRKVAFINNLRNQLRPYLMEILLLKPAPFTSIPKYSAALFGIITPSLETWYL